ncbi:MAG: TetR family transcriptional regulator [Deltaproteobacteria bacterium]|mgnify:FL=1|nr:TetR family transcriptional regulator [Deltaproteobacteria bacterium]
MGHSVKPLPAEERREVTVEAVIALAAEGNPSKITTAAIARRMGLSQGALFRHFASKDALMEAVMEWVAERISARIEKVLAADTSPLVALERLFLTHAGFVADHPGIPRLLFGELQKGEETAAKNIVRKLLDRYSERLKGLIEQGKACGEIEPDIDPWTAAALFIGSIQGLVMQSLLAGDVNQIRRHAPGVFSLLRKSIGRKT